MLVKTIINQEDGHKVEIIKQGEDNYSVKHYEFFQSCGWRFLCDENGMTKDCVEWEFDTEVA